MVEDHIRLYQRLARRPDVPRLPELAAPVDPGPVPALLQPTFSAAPSSR
jgi:hypothetical protein